MPEEEAATCPELNENTCEDMISALPEALLVQILSLLPTKDAVASSILSKPWRYIWTFLPKLVYSDTNKNKSFKPRSRFTLQCSAEPINLPRRLYTFNTLKELTLANKILVDVPFQAFLPSLIKLELLKVVYKDEDSLLRLLSSCHILQTLIVDRNMDDNVMEFSVKVPSLNALVYTNFLNYSGWSLIIDSPRLKYFHIDDWSDDDCLIERMNPSLAMASVHVTSHPNELFLRSLSSVLFLDMTLVDAKDVFCSTINFSQLIECALCPCGSEYWVESVMLLLHNSPKLKVLMISSEDIDEYRDLPPQRFVPGYLSSPLEIFEWKEYGNTTQEKHLLTYILENCKCLKTAGISMLSYYFDLEKEMIIMEELKSISRVSVSSQILFSVIFKWRSLAEHVLSF